MEYVLYPINIKIRKKNKIQIIKENLLKLKNIIKSKIKYLMFDRKNLVKKILMKLHI